MFNKTLLIKKTIKFLRENVDEQHILHKSRRGKIKHLSDVEILKDSEYPAEYFKSHILTPKAEITQQKGRFFILL